MHWASRGPAPLARADNPFLKFNDLTDGIPIADPTPIIELWLLLTVELEGLVIRYQSHEEILLLLAYKPALLVALKMGRQR